MEQKKMPFIATAAAALAFCFLAVLIYQYTYGSALLFHSDTLNAEEFFDDIFLRGGELAQWNLPHASYWVDFFVYCLIRFFTPDAYAASAAFAAAMAVSLGLAACYAIWPFAQTSRQKETLAFSCAVIPLILFIGTPYGFYLWRVLFHITTAVLVCLSIGCFFRFLLFKPGAGTYILFGLSGAAASASDSMFILWFTLPSCALVLLLLASKQITRQKAFELAVLLALPVLIGKGLDFLFKPNVNGNLLKPALRKILPTFFELGKFTAIFFTSSSLAAILGVISIGTFAAFFRKTRNGIFLLLLTGIIALTLSAFAVTGSTNQWYLAVFLSLILLLVVPFGLAQSSRLFSILAVTAFLVAGLYQALPEALRTKEKYSPAYARCVSEISKARGITNAIAPYDYTRPLQYLPNSGLSVTPFRHDYFLYHTQLTTPHGKKFEAPMLVLPRNESQLNYSRDTITAVNGAPEVIYECPDAPVSVWIFPQNARPGTSRDYVLDSGRLEGSFPDRDMAVWKKGDAKPGAVSEILSRFRMNRQWIVLRFDAHADTLLGKEVTVYVTGNKDSSIRRFAGGRVSADGASPMDTLWKRLAWSKTFIMDADNTFPAPDGDGTWFFFRSPDRETKKWLMTAISMDGRFTRIF